MDLNDIILLAKEIDTSLVYVKTKMLEPSKLWNNRNSAEVRKRNIEILNSLEEKLDDRVTFLESCYEENEDFMVQKTEQLKSMGDFYKVAERKFQNLNKILLNKYGMCQILMSSDTDDTDQPDSTVGVEKIEEKSPESKELVKDSSIILESRKYSQNACKFQPPEWASSNSNITFTPGLFPKGLSIGSSLITPVIKKS